MIKVNIHEAKTHLSRYTKLVKAGEIIWLCDRNRPFAEIRPLSADEVSDKVGQKRPLGLDRETVFLSEDWDSDVTNQEISNLFEGKGVKAPLE